MSTRKRLILAIFCVIAFLAVIEKAMRFTSDATFRSGTVTYVMGDAPASLPTSIREPLSSLESRDIRIEIPSFRWGREGRLIDPKAILRAGTLEGATYNCTNEIRTITCVGPFAYEVRPDKIIFVKDGDLVTPPKDWLSDVRVGRVIIYKFL